jgi:hypothetical protein
LHFWPPAAPTTHSCWWNLWTLFRYNFWHENILFDKVKLILMTCITVAILLFIIFAFSPITPCRSYCSTTGEVIHYCPLDLITGI